MVHHLARLLEPFNVRLLHLISIKKGFGNEQVIESDLETIMKEADVVSFHVPLTAETLHMAGCRFFRRPGKETFYITTCAEPVTDTEALCGALKNGKFQVLPWMSLKMKTCHLLK
jgi:D-3-phosphoglycerate dehydrogenase